MLTLNSLGTNLTMWDAQMPALVREHRVLRYDSRGHGSEGPKAPMASRSSRDVPARSTSSKSTVRFCGWSMAAWWAVAGECGGATTARAVEHRGAHRPARDMESAHRDGGKRRCRQSSTAWSRAGTRNIQGSAPGRSRRRARCCLPRRRKAMRHRARRCATWTSANRFRNRADPGHRRCARPGDDTVGLPLPGRARCRARYVELDAAHLSNVEAPAAFTAALTGFLATS